MKNYDKPGNVLTFTAPIGGVVSGTPVLIGALVVVPQTTVAQTLPFEGVTSGQFSKVPKANGAAWSEGQLLYWDSAAGNFATAQSVTARRAAIAVVSALAGDTTGTVFLPGVPSVVNVA